jgi:hypothetical protein
MDKKLAGLIGAVAALASLDGAQAATSSSAADVTTALRAESFAELLTPIPNALALLRAADQAEAKRASEAPGEVQVAQYYYRERHHHHHHNSYRRYRHHHHHHHHHHHGYYRY